MALKRVGRRRIDGSFGFLAVMGNKLALERTPTFLMWDGGDGDGVLVDRK